VARSPWRGGAAQKFGEALAALSMAEKPVCPADPAQHPGDLAPPLQEAGGADPVMATAGPLPPGPRRRLSMKDHSSVPSPGGWAPGGPPAQQMEETRGRRSRSPGLRTGESAAVSSAGPAAGGRPVVIVSEETAAAAARFPGETELPARPGVHRLRLLAGQPDLKGQRQNSLGQPWQTEPPMPGS
jgi:hypothetical protein